jgi:hypothetical protein
LERLHGYSLLYNLGLITENTLNNDVLEYYVKKYKRIHYKLIYI